MVSDEALATKNVRIIAKVYMCIDKKEKQRPASNYLELHQIKYLKSISWTLAEFGHNRIMQSPHENYFNVSRQHREK